MSITTLYEQYLRERRNPVHARALSDRLAINDLSLEALLLQEHMKHAFDNVTIQLNGSPWNGRRAWLGDLPSEEARVGDLWFDPLELVPMLLLPTKPLDPNTQYSERIIAEWRPELAWISLRPVAEWQYQAFLTLASLRTRPPLECPFPPFDRARIFSDSELGRVSNLTSYEALAFAGWTGKWVARAHYFEAAHRALSVEEFDCVLPPNSAEWGGWFDEDAAAVLARSIRPILQEEEEWEEFVGDSYLTTVDNWTCSRDVGFRTGFSIRDGLALGKEDIPYMPGFAELSERLEREEE